MTDHRHERPIIFAAALVVGLKLACSAPAFAFSQITGEDGNVLPSREGIVAVPLPPVPGREATPTTVPASGEQPADPTVPATVEPTKDNDPAEQAPVEDAPDPDAQDTIGQAAPNEAAPAEIAYGEDDLPVPVRDLRRKLLDVAKTGDIEKLRPLLETGSDPTVVSTQDEADPIQTLKDASGDGAGVEILAILFETLQAGHVRLDPAGENEIYVWPYFTQVNLEALTKPQLVELFELVTAGDYQRMVGNGSYDFYRVGISPEGRFEFFVAGD